MADNDASRGSSTKAEHRGILKKARADWDRAMERERDNIKEAYTDLEFFAGHEYSQWDTKAKQDRDAEGRPTLQINTLPQFVHQITGDMRQMKPSLRYVPIDDSGDEKVADILAGLGRYIENRSDAAGIYNRAGDSQVACGVGGWRILTEYADESTFNQEIRIAPIEDPVSVLWDPDASFPSKEDAKFCFVPVDMSKDAFKEAYPKASPTDWDEEKWAENANWATDDYVRVAEYWKQVPEERTLVLLDDGRIMDLTNDPAADAKIAELQQMATQLGVVPPRVEKRDGFCIYRYLITASEVLEEMKWPGRVIPVVTIVGEEIRIGRKLIRKGVVRDARDPQRMVNFFHSAHTEAVAIQPKAPWVVTERNIAKYQQMWESANVKNFPYMVFEPDALNGGQAPQRVAPPVSSQGVLDGLTLALAAQKQVIGIYDPGLGAKSNETSGKAIEARQREGDVGSYLYIDNFTRGIRRTGQILVDLIPHVYDTERTIRIMGEDGKVDILAINKAQGIGDQSNVLNDVTTGAYDVVAQIGPSYTTKREQAREGMNEVLRAMPTLTPLIADKIIKAQDWPMADDIAKRIRATLPAHILAMEEAEKQGMDPEQARQQAMQQNQPPPDPKLVEIQQKGQADQARLQMDAQMGAAKLQAEQGSAAGKMDMEREKMAAQLQMEREKMVMQMEMEREKATLQMEMQRQQMEYDCAMREREFSMKEQECAANMNLKAAAAESDAQLKRETAQSDTQIKRETAEAGKKPTTTVSFDANEALAGMAPAIAKVLQQNSQMMAAALKQITDTTGQNSKMMAEAVASIAKAAEVISTPKKVRVHREKGGDLVGEATPVLN